MEPYKIFFIFAIFGKLCMMFGAHAIEQKDIDQRRAWTFAFFAIIYLLSIALTVWIA